MKICKLLTFAALASLVSTSVFALDADAAKAVAKQNNCFKCHAVDKEKEGPALKSIAMKYKGKSDVEAKLIKHITSGEMAKFPDGHEEEHKIIKASPEETKNVVQWILGQ